MSIPALGVLEFRLERFLFESRQHLIEEVNSCARKTKRWNSNPWERIRESFPNARPQTERAIRAVNESIPVWPAASSLKGEPNTRECVRKRAMESLPGREVASNHREMARQTRRLQRIVKRVHPRNSGGEFRQDEQNTYPWVRLG